MNNPLKPFAEFAPIYRDLGYWPRPLLGKKCLESGWQKPNNELPDGTLERWIEEKPSHNIGLVAGSSFSDGTRLGFLDIDHDNFIKLGIKVFRRIF